MGRDLMGLPVGKTLVMFLDYLNMPLPEQYGAQPPLDASSSSATTASMISTITGRVSTTLQCLLEGGGTIAVLVIFWSFFVFLGAFREKHDP